MKLVSAVVSLVMAPLSVATKCSDKPIHAEGPAPDCVTACEYAHLKILGRGGARTANLYLHIKDVASNTTKRIHRYTTVELPHEGEFNWKADRAVTIKIDAQTFVPNGQLLVTLTWHGKNLCSVGWSHHPICSIHI